MIIGFDAHVRHKFESQNRAQDGGEVCFTSGYSTLLRRRVSFRVACDI
jgi:hypothetical protein